VSTRARALVCVALLIAFNVHDTGTKSAFRRVRVDKSGLCKNRRCA